MSKYASKEKSEKQYSFSKKTALALQSPVTVLFLTSLFYIQGRSYFTGYFSIFGTSPEAFDFNIADYYWGALEAWLTTGVNALDFIANKLYSHLLIHWYKYIAVIGTFTFLSLIATIITYRLQTHIQIFFNGIGKIKRTTLAEKTLQIITLTAFPMIATAYILFLFSMLTVLLALPFYSIGQHSARDLIENNGLTLLKESESGKTIATVYCNANKCLIKKNKGFGITPLPEKYTIIKTNQNRSKKRVE